MRRVLLIVLAVVLPLKAVAAAVVPITGGWAHAQGMDESATYSASPHGVHIGHAHPAAVQTSHSHCADSAANDAADDQADSGTVHEHACPHMGMASIVVDIATIPATFGAPELPAEPPVRFVSVIQEVPSPPPTFLR